ncbi:hypothetical protein M2324_003988 [Rhodovulum sulfidophilum]|nr:hypothetical protein [Rhodovulum sulfidophilum]
MSDIHQLPTLDLHMSTQRGYCDICRFGAVAAGKLASEEGAP